MDCVSIHAPRVGSDLLIQADAVLILCFNPRPPSGERLTKRFCITSSGGFNPRPPSGERHHGKQRDLMYNMFQSTPPEWGATFSRPARRHQAYVSIHAPRVGSDIQHRLQLVCYLLFQSTPPEWGATLTPNSSLTSNDVSIHAPRVGSDRTISNN